MYVDHLQWYMLCRVVSPHHAVEAPRPFLASQMIRLPTEKLRVIYFYIGCVNICDQSFRVFGVHVKILRVWVLVGVTCGVHKATIGNQAVYA
jgi:hypothetical protein